MSTNGKWIASHSEEYWSDSSEFDTREDAIAYAVSEIGPDYGVNRVYTGQIAHITATALADAVLDGSRVIEEVNQWLYERAGLLNQWLYDNVGDEVDYNLPCTRTQEDDLGSRLRAAFIEWMAAHAIAPRCYRIDHVKSHEVPEVDDEDAEATP